MSTLNLNKHLEFFNPQNIIRDEIHIIGCGAVGSNIAVQLAKIGCTNIYLWDFDTVDNHNVTNQIYTQEDVGKRKIDALEKHMIENNPDIKIHKNMKYTNQLLKGYVFSCVDSVELRHKIYENNQYNLAIKLIIDGRIGLERGQVYTAIWSLQEQIDNILELSNFKDSEVIQKFSACGTTLSISPTVLIVISCMVSAFINFVNKKKIPKIIFIDAFDYKVKAIY